MSGKLTIKITQEYNEYQEEVLTKSPLEIFNSYYKIYELSEIKSFFDCCEIPEDWEIKLSKIPNVLESLYEYELGYDEPQFMTWEAIENLIEDFLKELN